MARIRGAEVLCLGGEQHHCSELTGETDDFGVGSLSMTGD